MGVKTQKAIQTILLIIYFSVTPLLVNYNPIIFHDIKLLNIYISIFFIFLTVLIGYKENKELYLEYRKTFKWELILTGVALLFMMVSFYVNYTEMNTLITSSEFRSELWKGVGPNFLSLSFYFFSFLLISSAVLIVKNIKYQLISKTIVASLILVGFIIFYQIFVDDFLGRGQHYLFGWGNSNYTPDPFSIIGILLLFPLLFTKKINYFNLMIGILFLEIVLLSSSRAAYIALFISISISLLIILFKKMITLKKILIIFGFAVLIILFSYQLFLYLGSETGYEDLMDLSSFSENKTLDHFSLYNRVDLWSISFEHFYNNFNSIVFGIGQSVYIYDTESVHFLVTNAHNQYIDVLLSSGVIVLGIFIVLIYRQFRYAIKLLNYDIRNIVYLTCLIFITVKWLFNSMNTSHSPYIFLVFILISYQYHELSRQTQLSK